MKKMIFAAISCLFMWLGFVSLAAAADPVETGTSDGAGNPTNNGWAGN